jgi:selenophosphate synthetase-related protein
MKDLEAWAWGFSHQPELARKRAVGPLLEVLDPRGAGRAFGLGDDCGYMLDGRGYLLLSTDSIREGLLEQPRFAGFCAVNVAVNDIYATGGVPLALVDNLYVPEGDDEWAGAVAGGLREGCDFFELAMLGGHLDAGAGRRGLSVTALGRASSLMSTFGAVPGDAVLFTYDPEGRWHAEMRIWDASSGRSPERVLENYAVLTEIAEGKLASACRDVSNAGLPGTLAMLAAASGVGARLALDRVPRPDGIEEEEWLRAFPSYGFILTASAARAAGLTELLRMQGLKAAVCGEICEGVRLAFSRGGEEVTIDNPLT